MASCKPTSIKSLKYRLTLRVGAELTAAKLYHYRWLREYIENGFSIHFGGMNENPANYVAAVAEQYCDNPTLAREKSLDAWKAFADWKGTDIAVVFQAAKDKAAEARLKIKALNSTDTADLEVLIESIGSLVPVKTGGCKHCQC